MNGTDEPEQASRWGDLIELQPRQLIQVALIGLGVGVTAWVVGLLIREAIIIPLFCGASTDGVCANPADVAGTVAAVAAAVAGLIGLVRFGIYRPLIIVLATTISIWGLANWTAELRWFEALGWFAALYAICYAAFAWLVRPRSFVLALIAVTAVVVLARLLPAL